APPPPVPGRAPAAPSPRRGRPAPKASAHVSAPAGPAAAAQLTLVQLRLRNCAKLTPPHPCGEGDFFQRYLPVGCRNLDAPTQSILGADQRAWLVDRLAAG